MRFAFLDETHASLRGKKYSAAIASIWDASSLRPFRDELIRSVATLVNVSHREVNQFPTLHAVEMAKEYNDDVKLACFDTMTKLAVKFGVRFLRLGYYDAAPFVQQFDPLALAIGELAKFITCSNTEEIAFIYELNISKHLSIQRAYNDWHLQYLRMALDPAAISVQNAEMIFGRFYCDKQNYNMALSDTAAYVLRLADARDAGQSLSNFKQQILDRTSGILDSVALNLIVQVNDWPYLGRDPNGIVRYMFPITPSDEIDLSIQFKDFLDQLKVYWQERGAKK